jgi:hypothetical protein
VWRCVAHQETLNWPFAKTQAARNLTSRDCHRPTGETSSLGRQHPITADVSQIHRVPYRSPLFASVFPLNDSADGSVIISPMGASCEKQGDWKAITPEEQTRISPVWQYPQARNSPTRRARASRVVGPVQKRTSDPPESQERGPRPGCLDAQDPKCLADWGASASCD